MEISWDQLPDVTLLIRQSQSGDQHAEERLYRVLYPYLKSVAARLVQRIGGEGAMSAQDLVHDVYLGRLRGYQGAVADRAHYIALVTTAMKNELIDQARHSNTRKRSPTKVLEFPREGPADLPYEVILALEREIENMERMDWRAAQVVRLRYYAGCSWPETAAAVAASVRMVRRDWEFASDWLKKRLGRRLF